MDKLELQKLSRARAFIDGTGSVLRTANALKPEYARLVDVLYALYDMDEGIYINCLNYLTMQGYLALRTVRGHAEASADRLGDYKELEAKLTAEGVRLLMGVITDELVEV